ncbi:FadR family transcriptional regulator [Salmonella bongori]|uniref:FadR family transcriptional regulator n=6 Tax=Salmonella TaxID=590 RepID=A0A750KLU8_SALER|nr:Hexuronate utilization operon transcriptional repressor ExuR [Salmonella bongori N268-08]AID27159.1 GntR family transcriptional regulator [Salmonella bongori serovar 48:z41:-- str. RKS3044]ASG54777.1 FadR family transcriptional regulator [Salmonella bongori serovar 66:z41:- str. SA19983605]ECC8734079.1 FadR family transcriptional regulator [Salmonella bongori]ECG8259201.1 FadR family transcriptional regulator [Salmonella bongori serovar 48:i:-]EGE4655211.1 FadR family transcriptional regula
MVIPEVRQERLYQKIANLIIKLINDNIFPPGGFLPPERELAKQLGVSRASLREALIVLEISGWIVIQSGNGVIVSDKKHASGDYTVEEILSTRELVDSHCARLAAQNEDDDGVISHIETIYHSMEQAINDNNVHGFYSLDKEFHLAIAKASRNRVLFDMSRMLWEQRINIPYAGLDERSGDRNVLLNLNKQHKAIVDAVRQSDTDSAYQESLQHLSYVRKIVGG